MNLFLVPFLTIIFSTTFSPFVPASLYTAIEPHESNTDSTQEQKVFVITKALLNEAQQKKPAYNTSSEKTLPHVPEKAVEHSPVIAPHSPDPTSAPMITEPSLTSIPTPTKSGPTFTPTPEPTQVIPPIELPQDPTPCPPLPVSMNQTDREKLIDYIPCLH
jgi:hypothetical protein